MKKGLGNSEEIGLFLYIKVSQNLHIALSVIMVSDSKKA